MRLTSENLRQFFEGNVEIYLNGQVLKHVTVADEDAGFVIVEEIDAAGKLMLDGDKIRTRKLTGRVSIEGKRR